MSPSLLRLVLLLVAAAVLCFFLPADARGTQIHYCDGKGDYPVRLTKVEIHPNPVVSGRPAKFTISANTGDAIPKGKLVIDVSYFGIHVHEETRDLCEETSCPIKVGDFMLSHSQSLPFFTPPGRYTLKMSVLGVTDDELACITFDFRVGFGSSVASI